MKKVPGLPRDETVGVEVIFLDVELGIAAFQVADSIILDAMSESKVLSRCRRLDRISLHETKLVYRPFQGGGSKERLLDCLTAQLFQGWLCHTQERGALSQSPLQNVTT